MNAVLPILLLIALGWLARHIKILKTGDERILSAYVYYFALPALFFVDIANTVFDQATLRFIGVAALPIAIVVALFTTIKLIGRLNSDTYHLLTLSTVFGSTAFFGIPYIIFAFGTPSAEKLAVLCAAFTAMLGVLVSIFFLELHRLAGSGNRTGLEALGSASQRLLRNPLILSVLAGLVFSLAGWQLPALLARPLLMLGRTTATVAVFMLGVFLYGRKYTRLLPAAGLSLLRIILLPSIALLTTGYFALPLEQTAIIVLMHSMPLAVSMMVLSERYDFHQETIASLILISSLASVFYLNVWLRVVAQ